MDCIFLHNNHHYMQPLLRSQLLRGFNRGEEKARGSIFEEYHDRLLTLARRLTSNSPDSEDLVNDAFEILYGRSQPFKELSELRDFLFHSARNVCIDHRRRQEIVKKKYAELEEWVPFTDGDFYRAIDYSETRALIDKCIENLPTNIQTVFKLRYFENWSSGMIANQLHIPEKTVSNRYTEARKKLRWDLEQIRRFTIYLLNFFL
jgi:RNA polymerase sigma factor (sigma-70 family)